jgi:hypothetical protein
LKRGRDEEDNDKMNAKKKNSNAETDRNACDNNPVQNSISGRDFFFQEHSEIPHPISQNAVLEQTRQIAPHFGVVQSPRGQQMAVGTIARANRAQEGENHGGTYADNGQRVVELENVVGVPDTLSRPYTTSVSLEYGMALGSSPRSNAPFSWSQFSQRSRNHAFPSTLNPLAAQSNIMFPVPGVQLNPFNTDYGHPFDQSAFDQGLDMEVPDMEVVDAQLQTVPFPSGVL